MSQASLVWLTDDGSVPLSALATHLPETEQRELDRLTHPDRARGFALSRLLLRRELALHTQCPESRISVERAANGRLVPAGKADWHFSLSHAPGLVAVLVADAPCGVDIEQRRHVQVLAIARRYFAAIEVEWLEQQDETERLPGFLRLWTLKEAAVKALGTGLANNMARLAFSLEGDAPRLATGEMALQLRQLDEDPVFVAAAVATAHPVDWQLRQLCLADI
jgi:4'-phosphopantetheinyl transferase